MGDQFDQLTGQAEDLAGQASDTADRAQFCLAITRALTSLDGGSSAEDAHGAAEEVLTQVPDELRADAEVVADVLEEAAATNDTSLLDDPEFRDAATRLRDGTRDLCTGATLIRDATGPTGAGPRPTDGDVATRRD